MLRNSDGTPKEYKDIYGDKCHPGGLLLNGEEMLYELLASSPNTEGELVNAMKLAIYKYKNNISNVGEWDFGTFDEEEFIDIAA